MNGKRTLTAIKRKDRQQMARVLVACEYSGVVREAFRSKGHDAWSCDLLPTDVPGQHFTGDVTPILEQPWDLIIAHPPCTDLAVSGAKHFAAKIADGRQQRSIDFFMLFAGHPCPRIAIENPIGIMSTKWRKPDQIVHPYHFGDPHEKATCLWLKNLPPLAYTNVVKPEPKRNFPSGRAMPGWYYEASKLSHKTGERGKARSKTFQGFADAMANQWGGLI